MEYEARVNSENCDECYCLFCEAVITAPEVTGGFCQKCYDEADEDAR